MKPRLLSALSILVFSITSCTVPVAPYHGPQMAYYTQPGPPLFPNGPAQPPSYRYFNQGAPPPLPEPPAVIPQPIPINQRPTSAPTTINQHPTPAPILPVQSPNPPAQPQPRIPQPAPAQSGIPGKAILKNGMAIAPPNAPEAVKRAIQAGNALQNKPYKFGGGHASVEDSGYDCSGSVSYVLNKAGLMKGTRTSKGFLNYGEPGLGRWITVYTRDGHAYVVIAGLRLDTGGGRRETGPRWKKKERDPSSFIARHPRGH